MDSLIESHKLPGHILLEIHYDFDPGNPRKEYDNVGRMVMWAGRDRYTLGDEQPRVDQLRWLIDLFLLLYPEVDGREHLALHYRLPDEDWAEAAEMSEDEIYDRIWSTNDDWLWNKIRERCIILPISMYEHSAICLRASENVPDLRSDGYIYVSHRKARDEWPNLTDDDRKVIIENLIGEVDTYSDYVNGYVYGYIVKGPADPDGEREELDSCWGFYGHEDCEQEGRSSAEHYAKQVA